MRRPAPPPRRREPRFDVKPFLEREATEWKARAEQSGHALRQTLQAGGRLADSTGGLFVHTWIWISGGTRTAAAAIIGFFIQLWILLRAIALATINGIIAAAQATTRLSVAAGKSILVQMAAPAESANSPLPARLTIGALQGIGLALLAASHSMAAAAGTMVLLFVPLLLLAGIGRMPGRLLLSWTAIATVTLAASGGYQYWRGAGLDGTTIALAAIALFVGQALVMVWAKHGKPLGAYAAFHFSAWSLAIQVAVVGLCAAIALLAGEAAGNLLRQHFAGAHLLLPVAPLVTLAVALASWSLSPSLVQRLVHGLLALLTLLLLVLALAGIAVAAAAPLQQWRSPLLLDLTLSALLLCAINASYGAGEDRPRWRQSMEFLASAALLPLVALGGLALQARVAQLGWTAPRIFAGAALGILAAYAVSYLASALISLGGGGWMQRLERANLAMALVVLMVVAALASPLADPARLTAQSQAKRVESGQVDPAGFDFPYLRNDGLRFGQDALAHLATVKSAPDVARDAFIALTAETNAARPMPTQIGANIEVHGGQLPAGLLTRDWTKVAAPGVPPCLTSAALRCEAYFADLDGDGRDEILLVYGAGSHWWAGLMKETQNGWTLAGTLAAPPCPGSLDALRAGRFTPVDPLSGWRDLLVGGDRLTIVPASPAKSAACPILICFDNFDNPLRSHYRPHHAGGAHRLRFRQSRFGGEGAGARRPRYRP